MGRSQSSSAPPPSGENLRPPAPAPPPRRGAGRLARLLISENSSTSSQAAGEASPERSPHSPCREINQAVKHDRSSSSIGHWKTLEIRAPSSTSASGTPHPPPPPRSRPPLRSHPPPSDSRCSPEQRRDPVSSGREETGIFSDGGGGRGSRPSSPESRRCRGSPAPATPPPRSWRWNCTLAPWEHKNDDHNNLHYYYHYNYHIIMQILLSSPSRSCAAPGSRRCILPGQGDATTEN